MKANLPPFAFPAALWFARIALALIFLGAGINKILNFSGTVAYAESAGMPLAPVAIVFAIVILLGGAYTVVTGRWLLYGVGALLLFLLVATWFFHNPLTADQPMQQAIQLQKNLAIGGGLVALLIAQSKQ